MAEPPQIGVPREYAQVGPLRMTDALRRLARLVAAELRTLVPLVLLAYLPTLLVAAAYLAWLSQDLDRFMRDQWLYGLVQMPVGVGSRLLAEGAVIPVVFARLRGGPMTAGTALRLALRRILPLVGLVVALGIGVWVGMMLCFVPGIILYCAAYVAVPVLMVEEKGVEESLRRSFRLTAGYRWEVFGVIFVLWMVGSVLGFAALLFTPVLPTPGGFGLGSIAAMTGLQLLAGGVGTLLTAVAATVIYHALRVTKEGMADEELVEVFA